MFLTPTVCVTKFIDQVKGALELFDAALAMSPSPEEAQAALYNKACCHAFRWVHHEGTDKL